MSEPNQNLLWKLFKLYHNLGGNFDKIIIITIALTKLILLLLILILILLLLLLLFCYLLF